MPASFRSTRARARSSASSSEERSHRIGSMKMADVMLSVSRLTSGYGKKQILRGITLAVGEREVVSLMGRNGMGKTTTLRTLMGLTRAWSGRVQFFGKDISCSTPDAISRSGLGYVPEGRGIFPNLTVYENL